jgi:N-acetylated-alpha-linked acidic dipeptidase
MNDLERRILSTIDLDGTWSLVERLGTMVREHPRDVDAAIDVLVERLRSNGIEPTIHEADLYLSLPQSASVVADGRTLRAKAPAASASHPEGVEAELIYVSANYARAADDVFGSVDASTATRERVRGRIVVSEGYANPANVHRFEAWGALGVIAVNPGEYVHWGTCTTVWGNPGLDDLHRVPRIPAVNVNRPDGEALIALANAGGRATIVTEMIEGWFRSKLPVVEIRGNESPDEFVLLHGHIDAWDAGVGDNATGDATMAEIARVLTLHQSSLRRSVRIAWWPGHSTGRYAGSTWYADRFGVELDEGCVVQINCDSPGCRWATEYIDVSHTSETHDFASRVIREVANKTMVGERAHQAGDYSFHNIGISSHFMLLSTMSPELRAEKGYYAVGGCGANIEWHTEFDTIDIADRDILLTDVQIYLLSVLRHATAAVLDLDWRATAREFEATLAQYAAAAGEHADLSPARAAAARLTAALADFYDGVAAGRVAPRDANRAIRRLARHLIPVNFTRETRFFHHPALTIPPLPDLAAALEIAKMDAVQRGFARTTLMRGMNRFVASVNEALRELPTA